MIYENVEELIGDTPLLKLNKIKKELKLDCDLYGKLECFNPAGSIKDRAALQMINDYEEKGLLNKDTTIIEETSGNTGIGLACICAIRGYRLIIVMPENMSKERILTMKAYGAEVILTKKELGMQGAVDKVNELHSQIKGSLIAGQFDNPSNPKAHYLTTGPEIWNDLDGKVDYLVAGIGTGGTISGIGKYLKEKNKDIKIIGVEPYNSSILNGGKAGPHNLQGIGANFIPDNLDRSIYDEIIDVKEEDAYYYGKMLGKKEGILVGITAGAALYASTLIAKREKNKNIVVILPDGGSKYLSTEMYKE